MFSEGLLLKPDMDPPPQPIRYLCGDCGAETPLYTDGVLQCCVCFYKILYKKRTHRVLQYEAR
ncbi:putative RNA polymerase archaeal subunit P/eukaryotic subunit RPABC4 [Medicago truncatula]|uniref:Putative RNA polymerase archaeal subunit P/eukaryotic subunit RPABC4 n=1 Tax=Medicago truncatula TaxID=3880 RepID=A0A396H3N9_MEDTR|nr:DNA-directed RNA polymerases II, IV and V subunit 12-like [Medicago truncatula]RHN46334.1 putative RNA polymerase archaeal subunit P/eukaryotic subunit RPABC4 [Medicago truncatula]